MLSVKDQTVNILDFMGDIVLMSTAIAQLFCCREKAAIENI